MAKGAYAQLESALVDVEVRGMVGEGGLRVFALCHPAEKEKERRHFRAEEGEVFRSGHGVHYHDVVLAGGAADGGKGFLDEVRVVISDERLFVDRDLGRGAGAF